MNDKQLQGKCFYIYICLFVSFLQGRRLFKHLSFVCVGVCVCGGGYTHLTRGGKIQRFNVNYDEAVKYIFQRNKKWDHWTLSHFKFCCGVILGQNCVQLVNLVKTTLNFWFWCFSLKSESLISYRHNSDNLDLITHIYTLNYSL